MAATEKNEEKQKTEKQLKPFSMIPGPWPSLPFIGTGWHQLYYSYTGRYDLSKLHEVYIEKFNTYGPIFKEEFRWGVPIVHLFDPSDFETVFTSQGRCPIRPSSEFLSVYRKSHPDRYPNVGLSNMNGEEWIAQRQRISPTITTSKTINENLESQNIICQDFLDYLWNLRDPETNIVDDVQQATYRLSLESICNLCLDTRIGALLVDDSSSSSILSNHDQETTKTDGEIMIESTKLLFDAFNNLYYGYPFWKLFPTGPYKDLDKAETMIYDIAEKYVDQAMKNLSKESSTRSTVLQNLLKNKQLNQDEVKLAVIDFIIGGIFTVSNVFAYLFYHMASNPQVQDKLYEEIQLVIDDITQMIYLKACVKECLRLNCPVPGLMRITCKPIVLSGYSIPINTIVFSHIMQTCRLEKYFKNANDFRPERWLNTEEKNTIHPFSLIPFGYGNRMCLGKRFAESEIYLSLAHLIQNFKIELVPKDAPLELKHAFIVIPANPISIQITKR